MKEIVAEYPLVYTKTVTGPLTVCRLPVDLKTRKIIEIRHKVNTGLIEIPVEFPESSVSHLKMKNINSNAITYRGIASKNTVYYYAHLKNAQIRLFGLDSICLLEPFHFYYNVERPKDAVLRKAETREEMERRRKSYSFKARCIEEEEFKVYKYEDSKSLPDYTEKHKPDESKANISTINTELSERISECIRRARIVNYASLVEIFGNPDIIRYVIVKMTEEVCGRFVLKNSYYEKAVWDVRRKVLDMFKKNGAVDVSKLSFLGIETWIVDEIAYKRDKKYILKGYKENEVINTASIRVKYISDVNSILNSDKMVTISEIAAKTGVDEEVLVEILENGSYISLANNSYILNDSSLKAKVLSFFVTTKTVDLNTILESLRETASFEEIVTELKKYCTHRGEKYHLKNCK